MPTYEYRCKRCGHEFEEIQKITAPPLTQCPVCHEKTLTRIIGAGSGLIFKGSGFYITDYKRGAGDTQSKGTKKKQKGEEKSSSPDGKPESSD